MLPMPSVSVATGAGASAPAPLSIPAMFIVCRSDEGIYEVEQYLKRIHGKRLSIISSG